MFIYVLMYIEMYTFLLFGCYLLLPILNGDLLKTLEVKPPPKVRVRADRSIVGL